MRHCHETPTSTSLGNTDFEIVTFQAFHCHMAWHSEAGLVMQFLSRVDEVATWAIPEANRQLCEAEVQELEKGACPPDSTWFGFGIGG